MLRSPCVRDHMYGIHKRRYNTFRVGYRSGKRGERKGVIYVDSDGVPHKEEMHHLGDLEAICRLLHFRG